MQRCLRFLVVSTECRRVPSGVRAVKGVVHAVSLLRVFHAKFSMFKKVYRPMMKTLFIPATTAATVALASLSACSSPGLPAPGAANAGHVGEAPMIYVQSARQPADITRCLQDRASDLRSASLGNAMQLGDGHDWLITLTPSRGGSIVAVQKAVNASDSIPEPEMRFDIARCTT
jgi:hypothetical protein